MATDLYESVSRFTMGSANSHVASIQGGRASTRLQHDFQFDYGAQFILNPTKALEGEPAHPIHVVLTFVPTIL
jgi:hypothetical protein